MLRAFGQKKSPQTNIPLTRLNKQQLATRCDKYIAKIAPSIDLIEPPLDEKIFNVTDQLTTLDLDSDTSSMTERSADTSKTSSRDTASSYESEETPPTVENKQKPTVKGTDIRLSHRNIKNNILVDFLKALRELKKECEQPNSIGKNNIRVAAGKLYNISQAATEEVNSASLVARYRDWKTNQTSFNKILGDFEKDTAFINTLKHFAITLNDKNVALYNKPYFSK